MAKRGEDVYGAVDQPARDAFPRVVRALVTQVRSDVPASTRRVSERAFAEDPAAAGLTGALREARLIISDRGELRFTHDSLLTGWARLKDQIAEEQRLFGARERLEQYCDRWVESANEPKRARNQLLLEGFPLAEGRELLAKWGAAGLADRQPELPSYIKASDKRDKQARVTRQVVWLSIAAILTAVPILLYFQQQSTKRAQQESEASLWVAQSQSYLRDRNVAAALDYADRAFKSVPTPLSRSTLLTALMETSPHKVRVTSVGPETAEALAWIDGDTLAFASGSGQVRAFPALDGQSRPRVDTWSLPAVKRKQDGNDAVVRVLRPLGPDRMLAIFDEGSISVVGRGARAAQPQQSPQEMSINPTAHAAAAGRNGATIVMASVEEAITVHRCNWTAAQARSCEAGTLGEARGRAVAVSPDEKRIAVGGEDGTVTVYDAFGKTLGKPLSIGAPIVALGWAEQRDWIAAGTSGGEIAVLDVGAQTEPIIAREKLGERPITALAWGPKDLNVAFVCDGSSICLWQADAGDKQPRFKPIIRFEGHVSPVTRLNWSPNGRHLASTATDGTIRIWDLVPNTDGSFALYSDQPAELVTVATSFDGKWLAAGAGDGTIRLFDAATGALAHTVTPPSKSEVEFLAWSRNGSLAAIYESSNVGIVSRDRQQPEIALEAVSGEYRIAWTDEGRILAVPLRDSRVALIDMTGSPDSRPVYLGTSGAKAGWGIAVDPAGRTLFVGHANGEIVAWDLATKKPAPALQNTRPGRVQNVAAGSLSVSPDGRWLAASGADRFVTIYDLTKRTNWLDLETEASETRAVAFSPGGQRLAALGMDHRVYVWDFENGMAKRALAVDAIPTRATMGDGSRSGERAGWLAWMSDDTIAVATASSAITVIRLDQARWRQRIDALAQRKLTP